MVGQTVGKYRIVSHLGRGGMGTVYKAVDQTLDREVAIKSINSDLSDPETLKRFRAEALALAKLNHPNIAMLFELTEHEGSMFMVMEFVRGETFEALSQRSGPLPVDYSRDLCCQVLDALGHAHRAGIVHRDLKPANLMLTDSGLVKVMDFGLARMLGTEHLTTDGFMVGTPAYMAPEQVLAEEIDGRADLYAVGVVLFRLLTAQLPFKADSGISMAHKQVHDAPTPVQQLRTELPAAYGTIIGRALTKSPADRFQTADEFKSALTAGRMTAGRMTASSTTASSTTPALRSASTPAVVSDQPTVVLPKAAPAMRRSRVAVGLLIAGVMLGGALAMYVGRQPARSPQPVVTETKEAASGRPAVASAALPPDDAKPPTVSHDPAPSSPGAAAASSPPEQAAALPSVTFAQIKLLLLDAEKPHDRDVSVTLAADSLDVMDGATLVQRARYHDVIGLYHSHSHEPRWTKPDGTAAPLAKIGGRFAFLKSPPDWITIQTKSQFIPLHVPESELARLVAELETHTGSRVVFTR
jgi:serine/threonine-protein kinase